MSCKLCPNLCEVDRARGVGLCLAGGKMVINRAALHYYEEPPISGTRGSGTVFFGGCTMKCIYCQNYLISRRPSGKECTPKELAEIIKRLEGEGAHNINLVTPTHFSDGIKKALDIYRPRIPIVYNTSGYELKSEIEALEDYVDIYLPDFKYSDSKLAAELSGRPRYPELALEAIGAMLSQKRNRYDSQGIMLEGVIIRHMVIPGEVPNSIGVLEAILKHFGSGVTLSLMSQFTPIEGCGRLPVRLKPIEYKAVVAKAEKLGFSDVFIQELSSAKPEYTPPFDID
ncbi:MAG TPA: radical SAM protein [Clostridia bacterium]|nr:radical SAM protein [Clostridia bacterium]HOL61617.1 radical SAM protein [Clostridia bacterium]HPO54257.1 radical SAM protein [Clostridia bacterium]